MIHLSSFNRPGLLKKLSSESFDLLIIGGGITGAGIALDAASRGLKTALIEKQDFASGTSSRSTKLIHGGLRYLKNFEFGLVKEVGHERTIAYHNAPHLVIPEKMLLPLVEGGTYGEFATSAGLFIYDFLAGVKMSEWRKMLSKEETLKEEPLLRSDILQGGGLYVEYRTDDARLTIEVIKTAAKYGALAVNYFEATKFIYENNRVSGVECEDVFTKDKFFIKSKQIINAAGPWVDKIRNKETEDGKKEDKKRLHLTKGVHIVIPKEKLNIKHSVYFDVDDGRMIFTIPRGKVTYIGTTDTDYSGNIENPVVLKSDAEYLLNAANRMFPTTNLKISDIISSWAGLRPLIHEEGKSPSELSRKDEIFVSESGLISIAGGKLTGFRKMAEKAVNLVSKKLNKFSSCKTERIIINGGEFETPQKINGYIREISDRIKPFGLEEYFAEYLVRTYGKQTEEIIEKIFEFTGHTPQIAVSNSMAKAELWFAVNNESVQKLQDFFIRRTGRLLFEPESVPKLLPLILEEMKKYFEWSETRCETEKKEMEFLMKQSVTFE